MIGKYMVVGISALVGIWIHSGGAEEARCGLIASDSERMVIYLINTVRHRDTESSDINLQILYACREEWCPRV